MPFNPAIQSAIGITSPMSFSDGVRTVTFSDCKITDVQGNFSDGQTMTIAILDRRWKWRFGQISGRYNIRVGGQIETGSKKNPRELLKLVFQSMGDSRYDVRQVPVDTFPYIDWDLTTPDAALTQICDAINCHVCLGFDDVVRIVPDGVGADLPDLPSSSSSVGLDVGVRPGKVGVASGLMRWQFDFPLTPVGLDVDGKVKPIDELSYRPKSKSGKPLSKTPWEGVDPVEMWCEQTVDTALRKLAVETVWRWYRIRLHGKANYRFVCRWRRCFFRYCVGSR
jgi:hypothetical protein